jgi:Flp pilus assembly protein TadB
VESFGEVVGPVAAGIGERLSRLFGVTEELGRRLDRIGSPLDVTAFRVRQVGRSAVALGVAVLAVVAIRPPLALVPLLVIGLPLLVFLLSEQQVARASSARQRRLENELPVVAEQLAMLMSSGFSLGAALNRLAQRGSGVAAEDLRVVTGRIRQGLSESRALAEWADLAQVPALDRLVAVLARNRETTGLARLISDEAKGIRNDAHRRLIDTMETRSQQVWIPVTVATLVPGVIFLTIPFIEALRLFTGS